MMMIFVIPSHAKEESFSFHQNNQAYLLDMDSQALLARFELLEKEAPFLSTYMLHEDHIGYAVMAKLIQAAKEGRKPRLLLDWAATNVSPDIIYYLIDHGVEVRQFQRGRDLSNIWNNGIIAGHNRRMHCKIITTADDHMITGGRNWSDGYMGLSSKEKNIDMDVMVKGEAARDARNFQEFLWDSKYVQKINPPVLTNARKLAYKKIETKLENSEQFLITSGLIPEKSTGQTAKYLKPVENISFVWDHKISNGRAEGSGDALIKLIREAQSEILIETQYLLPVKEVMEELKKAADRGVKIKIITNGPDSAANSFSRKLTVTAQEMRRKLMQYKGIEVIEVSDKWLHSKVALIDGTKALVWSHNFDPRSWNINLEAGVQINDFEFGQKLKATMDSHISMNPTAIRDGKKLRKDACIDFFKGILLRIPTVHNNL